MSVYAHARLLSVLAATSALAAVPAMAQIEEIVVTAQKRAESLQDVPLAVTALSANTIEQARVEGLNDVALRTPNFTIGQQNPSEPELTIRGIGSGDREAGSDRSVTVFVDEIYVGRAGASTFDMFDLERIEVLRGPQGTLFGRNVVGGAISLITAKPGPDQLFKGQLTVGTHDLIEARAAVNQPLSDKAAIRVSGSIKERDGYFYNKFLNIDDIGGIKSRNVRAQVAFYPQDELSILLSGEYAKDKMDGVAARITAGAATPANFAAAMAGFGNYVPPADLFTVESNVKGFQDRDIWAASARVEYTGENVQVTFIPAYRGTDYASDRDLVGIPVRGTGAASRGFLSREIIDEDYSAFSTELRLASVDKTSPLSWVIGGYYLNEDVQRDQIRERQANDQYSRPLFDQSNKAKSTAVFGQATYAVIEDLRLTAGARYTHDDKDFGLTVANTLTPAQIAAITASLGRAPTLNPATAAFTAVAAKTWSEFTPKGTIDFSVNENTLLFAGVSKGFKSGGFNGLGATAVEATTLFDPETAWNYEIGAKTTFADDRVQLNVSAFRLDFKDLQLRDRKLTIPGDESSAIVNIINAAKARIEGVEAEFIVAPVDGLTLSGFVSTLDAEIVGVVPGSTTIVGTALPRAPKTTVGLSGNYEFPLGNAGDLNLRADWRHTSKQYYDINEPPASLEPGYGLLDVRVGFDSADGPWGLSGWCKNVTDKEYRSHVQQISAGRAGVTQVGDPRQCGVTLNVKM